MQTLYSHEGATLSTTFSPKGDYFASGGADKQAMVWRAPLEEWNGEVIEGLKSGSINLNSSSNNINSPGSDKNIGMDWNQSLYASVFPNDSVVNNNMNNTMNMNAINNNSLLKIDSNEENMMIMDKVMTTLDQIVVQLDDMNQGLSNIERRVINLEKNKEAKQ